MFIVNSGEFFIIAEPTVTGYVETLPKKTGI
jgi:hypothetical protein